MSGESRGATNDLYRTLARVVYLATGVVIVLFFLDAVVVTLLFFLLAVILAMALNPPVTWLEQKGVHRTLATLMVILVVFAIIGLLAWLIMPRLLEQVFSLAEDIPGYVTSLVNRVSVFLEDYPEVRQRLQVDASMVGRALPSAVSVLTTVGRYSLSALVLVVFGIILASVVIYMLMNPRPLIRGLLAGLPPHMRDPVSRATVGSSRMISGWITSNLIIGGVEGVAAAIFLGVIGIPGWLLWGVLTFFSELVPKVGPYLMTIPPAIVALAIDPVTALWVVLFYVALNEITGDVIAPYVRGEQMNLHPVSLIFTVLVMASLFGILGALIATPLTGFIKAFYEELHLADQPKDPEQDKKVEGILAWWKRT